MFKTCYTYKSDNIGYCKFSLISNTWRDAMPCKITDRISKLECIMVPFQAEFMKKIFYLERLPVEVKYKLKFVISARKILLVFSTQYDDINALFRVKAHRWR